MATFKEAFAAARKEKGAGKTFTWNGKSYTTDMASDKKSDTGTKPKAKPAGLNSQSGAAQSGTAGKASPAAKRPAKAAEISGQKAAPSLSGASRSTAGKVAPKMSQTEKAMADAMAAREKSQLAGRGKTTTRTAVTTTKTPAKSHLELLGEFLAGGGMSGADRRAKAIKKALGARR